ncbi:MAG: ribonuclease III [Alphaproteobacteria bacterium]|nr:ribonuclease III [Alphaproteobacteria bacterium]MBO4644701.1 ribonuclease III [Alphaproteobacteria bacterium]
MTDLAELYPALGYNFKSKKLLKQALTLGFENHFAGYERLEFLGDRVLGVIIADMLFRTFSKEPEGDLARRFTALTRAETLACVAKELQFELYLISAVPSNKPEPTTAVLSDICEAVIAALFLDGGLEAAKQFVARYWTPLMEKLSAPPVDSKTKLQEWAQARKLSLPVYAQISREGPDHNPVFIMQVSVEGFAPVSASGKSKREASQAAAAEFFKILENK